MFYKASGQTDKLYIYLFIFYMSASADLFKLEVEVGISDGPRL